MSERLQRTAFKTSQRMSDRYGDEEHQHKHDKTPLEYRQHCRTHPCDVHKVEEMNETGMKRRLNLRKLRKRLDKGRYH